jgi:hypothetical protein
MKQIFNNQKGITAISTILLVGSLISEIALASLISSYLLSDEGLGLKIFYQASFASRAGVNDAILKIIKNKDILSEDYTSPIDSSRSARVIICKESTAYESAPTCSTPSLSGQYSILSISTILNKKSKLSAVVSVNGNNGLVSVQSISEAQ